MEASLDTIEMMLELPADIRWSSHAEYLKRLRREANVTLARLNATEA